jgi:hypothetical protein
MHYIPHLIVTLALALTTMSLHIIIQGNASGKSLDTARLYTMVREPGDTQNALELLNDEKWLTPACQAMTDLSVDTPAVDDCRALRVSLRDLILEHLKCTLYSSQVCSYIRLVVSSLARNTTQPPELIDPDDPDLGYKVMGMNLAGKPTGWEEEYRQILYEAVEEAPKLFHSSYRAMQSNSFIVMRSMLYNLIGFAILGNFIVHVLDSYTRIEKNLWSRFLVLLGGFFSTFFVSSVYVFWNSGAWGPLMLIALPAFFNLLYFEMFLDPTMVRPWIHPYMFTVVYSCLSLLALVENDVLNYSIVIVELLKAQAASQLYMSVTWYWVGLHEKMRLGSVMEKMYRTKEVQWALYMSLVVVTLFPGTLYYAPYNFSNEFQFMAASPVLFTFLSLASTLYLQDLRLDDQYDDKSPSAEPVSASHITSSKLYVSMLVLGFGTLVVFNLMGEHWRTYRAYLDAVPDKAMQYDLSVPYLMGQGLTALRMTF